MAGSAARRFDRLGRVAALAIGIGFSLLPFTGANAQDAAGGTAVIQSSGQGGRESVRRDGFHASAYLPLGHWAYALLDHWLAEGHVEGLSPFVRPYRRMDIARAIAGVDAAVGEGPGAGWLARLRDEFAPELAVLRGADREERLDRLDLSAEVGATYRSQTHRDPLRPELEGRHSSDRLLERAFVNASGAIGPITGGVRVGRDGIFLHDAQFPGGRVVPEKNAPLLEEAGVRMEEGYLALQTRYASLSFGRMYRNWAPPGLLGFIRSDYAYSEEELTYRVGVERLFLTGSYASLRDLGGDTTRHLSMHRVEARPWDELAVAVTEAVIHGGPSQPLDLALLNPVGIWHIVREDGRPQKNAIGQVDLWWRAAPGLAIHGTLLADATGRSSKNTTCCQMGGSLGFDVAGFLPGWLLRVRGSALQSLVYRTSAPWEEWSVRRIGLGWDKADLYLGTVEAEWLAGGGLILRPRLDLQVRGEGDFRRPRPGPDVLADFPNILLGETETTLRPALGGRWRPGGVWGIDVAWDVGVNFIDDYEHRTGDDRTEFVGSVRAVVETPRWTLLLSP